MANIFCSKTYADFKKINLSEFNVKKLKTIDNSIVKEKKDIIGFCKLF